MLLNNTAKQIGKESKYNDDCERLIENASVVYIFVNGKLKGKSCVKASINEYNEIKNTNLDPSSNHVCFFMLDEKGNKTTIHRVLAKDFAKCTETENNEALCKKCGHRTVSEEAMSFVKSAINNKNMPKEVINQIKEISEDGTICFQCQRFVYLGEYMKLSDIVRRVNAKDRLVKKLETIDMPKCTKCACILDNEEVELNKAFGKEDKMLCSIHLLEATK